jgi:hypothetical protein
VSSYLGCNQHGSVEPSPGSFSFMSNIDCLDISLYIDP